MCTFFFGGPCIYIYIYIYIYYFLAHVSFDAKQNGFEILPKKNEYWNYTFELRVHQINNTVQRNLLKNFLNVHTPTCEYLYGMFQKDTWNGRSVNLLAPELLFYFKFYHTLYIVWIIQEPNKLELWNKLHFEEKKTENIYHV